MEKQSLRPGIKKRISISAISGGITQTKISERICIPFSFIKYASTHFLRLPFLSPLLSIPMASMASSC
uniref:Uncharacterized protein n=3 Tax=Oryza TaxID=4527 RepID=A0A0E0N6Y0_ORYRU